MTRTHWFTALALLAASPTLAQASQENPEQVARSAKLGKALAAINSNKPADAIAILDPLLADYEKLYAAEKGRIFCAHNPKQTILYASDADAAGMGSTVLGPDWCTALWARGFALIDLKQVDAAIPFLKRAVALSPAHAHYLSELAYAYQVQRKWQLSYDIFQRAAAGAMLEEDEQRKKSLRRAWFGMGYDLIELGRLEEAEKMLSLCLELTPDDQKIRNELQYVRDQRKKKS
jgi:tetratricopeptide (TPR) repeat protein